MAEITTVKFYQSNLKGEEICLNMYRQGKRYGIAILKDGTVIAPDYKNGSGELRTFPGNEHTIIDWTSMEDANDRYIEELHKIIGAGGMPSRRMRAPFIPRLVNG